HFKYNKIVTPKGRLYINFFRGFDTFSSILEQERANQINESISKKKWGNTLASFRYNYSTNTHMFLNFSGYFSEYSYNNLNRRTIEYRDITSEYILDYYNTIRDFGGNTDFHYSRKKFESQTGGQIIHHTYIPNKI